jgi:hypothetical protein
MKEHHMTMKTKLAAALASACAATAAIAGGAIATAGATHTNSGNQLAGTWTAAVNRPAPLPPITSLQVYTGAGSMVESGNDTASRSPQYGSWERTEDREYAYTGEFFRFDPATGAFVGRQKINRTIDLSEDGQSFTFHGRATIYDAHDNVLADVPVSGTGQRLGVETHQ